MPCPTAGHDPAEPIRNPRKLDEALLLVLPERPEDLGRVVHVLFRHDLVDIVRDERGVEEERRELQRNEEECRQCGVRYHFWEDELRAGAGREGSQGMNG